MNIPVQIISFILLTFVTALAAEESQNLVEVKSPEQDHLNGLGNEIIQSKLDILEFRFTELFVQLKEQGEAFLNNQRRVEDEQRQLNQIVDRHERKIVNLITDLENSVGNNVTLINDQSRQILELQTICSNHDSIRSQLLQMHPKGESFEFEKLPWSHPTVPEACTENGDHMSGLCRIWIGPEDVVVYREQVRFGGNWVVILQRYDGSELFNRSWVEYREGFGRVGREFWIGLEWLHLLTVGSTHELLVELEDFNGNYTYARYDKFSVGPEEEEYPLSMLGEYVGTAGDAMRNHVGVKFQVQGSSSKDTSDCSKKFGSGWYYNNDVCYNANPMGIWQKNATWYSIIWDPSGIEDPKPLKFIRMMVRRLED